MLRPSMERKKDCTTGWWFPRREPACLKPSNRGQISIPATPPGEQIYWLPELVSGPRTAAPFPFFQRSAFFLSPTASPTPLLMAKPLGRPIVGQVKHWQSSLFPERLLAHSSLASPR